MFNSNEEVYTVIGFTATLLLFIIAYFAYSVVRQRNIFIKWQEARIKAEIDTLENERRRIASDLHDDIGPMLSAIKLHVNHVEPGDEEERKIIEKSGKLMDDVIQRFRDIAYNLLPNTLIRKGLLTAVAEFTEKINEAHTVNISFVHDDSIHLSPEDELNLYRIVQEIIHNTIKHAHATTLSISLQQAKNQIVFTTTDNGIGFTYDAAAEQWQGGLGFMNIRNRVVLLNGKMSIKSAPGKGTNYIILIPLSKHD